MPDTTKGSVTVVSACMRPDGLPDFAITEVQVTPEEYENGVHYDLVDKALIERKFEEPFLHFDEVDAPAFLLPAVREMVAASEADTAILVAS